MLTIGNVAAPIGHTRGLPTPNAPVPIRPVQRRNTSPFTTTAPTAPDPDAVARLERLGIVTVTRVTVDDKPKQLVTRRKTRKKGNRGTGTTRLKLDEAALAEEYLAGATLAELAAKHGAAQQTILTRLREKQVPMRGVRVAVPAARIVELHQEGLSNKEIAAQVGLSDVTVGNRLRDAGIRGGRPKTAVFDEDRAIELAREGLTPSAIAKRVGVCRASLIDRLAQHGVTFEDHRRSTDIERLLALGREGKTITQIADILDVSERTVSTHLKRAEITPPDGRRGYTNAPLHDITPEMLADDYRSGLGVNAIAKKRGISRATVRRRLAAVPDLQRRDDRSGCGGANRIHADVEADIAARYQAGASIPEVAAAVGLAMSTVHGALHRLEVPMRTTGEAQLGRAGVDGAADLKELMRSNGVISADVRAWAMETGRDIPPRGLPSRRLLEDYLLDRRNAGQRTA